MEPKDFCNWLKGYMEGTGTGTLVYGQVTLIKQNLDKVFIHDHQAVAYPGPKTPQTVAVRGKEIPVRELDSTKPKFEAMC